MNSSKIIRDPIHGNILLNELELKLIDLPYMQRLRNVKQNGFCFLVYPAMNSTRFEHSLGVMHLAGLVSDHLGLDDVKKMSLRIAGLLHDVGHAPFSHTLDKILIPQGFSHEKTSSQLVLKSEISDLLKENGLNPKDISDLILGKSSLSKVLCSEIDVDKMDYLKRDSYYAGVAYGVIDLERLIYAIKMVRNEIIIAENNLETIESVLINRNLMYQTVYRHHTKCIAESMFLHAVDKAIEDEKITPNSLITLDDIQLTSLLRNSGDYTSELMVSIDERKLFKTFFNEKVYALRKDFRDKLELNEKSLEEEIAGDYKVPKEYLFVDAPEPSLSEFRVRIEHEGSLKRIDRVSTLAKSLEKSEQDKLTLGMYTHPRYLRKLKDFNPKKYLRYRK